MRYILFPGSRELDERTAEIERQVAERKEKMVVTRQIVSHANQPDVLRNLVIAMQEGPTRNQ